MRDTAFWHRDYWARMNRVQRVYTASVLGFAFAVVVVATVVVVLNLAGVLHSNWKDTNFWGGQ